MIKELKQGILTNKKQIVGLILTLVLLTSLVLPFAFSNSAFATTWWNTSWSYRKQITFNNASQSANLTNFPVGVFLKTTNFTFSEAQAALQDIRFIDNGGSTALPYEIVAVVANTSAEIWVNVPQVDASSSTDFIYMYYGNGAASDAQNVTGTWNSNYIAVYHMNDNPDTSHIKDSTADNWTGTKQGAGHPAVGTGILDTSVGKAQVFPYPGNTNDQINCGTGLTSLNIGTVEAMFQAQTTNKVMVSNGNWGTDVNGFNCTIRQNHIFGEVCNATANTRIEGGTTVTNNATNYYAFSWEGVNSYLNLYLNGASDATHVKQVVNPVCTTYSLRIGLDGAQSGSATYCYDKVLDEIRISNIARPATWVAATYLTLHDTFNTFGTEETSPAATVSPTIKAYGTVLPGATSNTTLNYFTVTNNCTIAIDVTIQGADLTGSGDTWTLSDNATVGDNIYGLKAGLNGGSFNIIVEKSVAVTLVSNLAASANQTWGLQILMPSAVTGGHYGQMTSTITLVASAH